MAIIAQAELSGRPFGRTFYLNLGRIAVGLPYLRQTHVGALLNDETGDVLFRPAMSLPPEIALFPQLPIKGTVYNYADHEGPSLANILKMKTSTLDFDVDASYILRGGNLKGLPKVAGFSIENTRKTIEQERVRKNMEVTYGQEVAATLEGGKRHNAKKTGFMFTTTASEVMNERKRKREMAKRVRDERRQEKTIEFP